jgi:hypothetical protein
MRLVETRTGLQVLIRGPRVSDDGYIFRSALGRIRTCEGLKNLPQDLFYASAGELFRNRWNDQARTRLVACLPTDEDFILGFALGEPTVPLVDYVHTRGGFTGQGVATLLLHVLGLTQERTGLITFATVDYRRRRSWPLLKVAGLITPDERNGDEK